MRRRQVEFGRVTTLVNKIKNMVRSFTTSQAIKAKVYKFRAQAATYTSAKSNSKRSLKLFQQRCQGLSSNARQYDSKFDLMLQDSKPPPPAGVLNTEDGYIEGRLDKQINNVYMKEEWRCQDVMLFVLTNMLIGVGIYCWRESKWNYFSTTTRCR